MPDALRFYNLKIS